MATIYRFIVEQKTTQSGGGRKSSGTTSKKGAGKKGKDSTNIFGLLGMGKGGVEHNRYTRAINPLLNKATGGLWEKGARVGRAAAGLFKFSKTTGAILGVSAVAIAILVSFAIQTTLKIQQREIAKMNKLNTQNYKMLENGGGAVHGAYNIATNSWNGRHTYNQNK